MGTMDILINRIAAVAREAGDRLLSQKVVVNHHKTANDLLTENDLQTEAFIIEQMRKTHPQLNIVSEEYHPDNDPGGITLVIDPIDGTCNYAVGMDLFGIQFAVFIDKICRGAVLYFPVSGDLITAQLGKGTCFNGKPIMVNRQASASDGILLISDYYPNLPVPMEQQFQLVHTLQQDFLKTRHFGAACIDFSMLIKGHALGYITYYHKIWDIAPGLLAASEAGCVHTSLIQDSYTYGSPGLVVANNPQTLQKILDAYAAVRTL